MFFVKYSIFVYLKSLLNKLDSDKEKRVENQKPNYEINDLPNEILLTIFSHLPANDLCRSVILTCKKWNSLIDSDEFWTSKLLKENKLSSSLINHLRVRNCFEPKKLYFKNPLNKENLLRNSSAELGFSKWFTRVNYFFQDNSNYEINNENNSFYFEKMNDFSLAGRKNLKELDGFIIEDGNKFVTTRYMCSKYQIIDLYKEGLNALLIKNLKPKIEVIDNYAGRPDKDTEYHIRVGLYDSSLRKSLSIAGDHMISKTKNGNWNQFRHLFEEYPDSLRYIVFHHGGFSPSGTLGVKMTNSIVRLILD